MKQIARVSLILLFALTLSCTQKSSDVFVSGGSAASGFDVVSYFDEAKPVKGSKEYATEWHDATWLFSSSQNLERFKADPERYAPQYGGYCAYGTADGHKAPTDPNAWTIVDDKLYLNYNSDVKVEWLKDTSGFIQKANKNWPEVKLQNF